MGGGGCRGTRILPYCRLNLTEYSLSPLQIWNCHANSNRVCVLVEPHKTLNYCCFRLGDVVGPTSCCMLVEPHRILTPAVASCRVPRSPQLPHFSPLTSRDPSSPSPGSLRQQVTTWHFSSFLIFFWCCLLLTGKSAVLIMEFAV